MIVMKTPATTKNPPIDSTIGNALFAYRTAIVQDHVQMRYATNTCHLWITKSGWNRAYMETVWAPTIWAVAAVPKIQARKFNQPAKKPTMRPYFPAVTEAQ